MHIQFDNVGTESIQNTPAVSNKPKGPGYGSINYPLSEKVQSAITEWGLCDAARYYASHGIKIREFLILAGPMVRQSIRV